MAQEWEIAIVGSGPAGAVAAWTIGRLFPELAERTVLLEAGHHPREKICAGCVTGRSWRLLKEMGFHLTVSHVPINAVRFLTALGDITLPRNAVGRIVRRGEFDAALLDAVRQKGVAVHERTKVLSASYAGDRIQIVGAQSSATMQKQRQEKYLARVAIGADGATSVVRRHLGKTPRQPAKTAMVEVPVPQNFTGLPDNMLAFDFRPVSRGLRGYRWIFPSLSDTGARWVSVGVCDFDPLRRSDLRPEIEELLSEYGLSHAAARWREYPFYSFDMRDTLGGPGWLLAGEAAGSDNLLAEGISYAVESGVLAAEFAVNAFRSNDFSMQKYTHHYHWSRVGKELRTLKALADMFYSPLLHMRVLRAGLFNEELCAIGGEILAGELEPRTKLALRIAFNLLKTMGAHALKGLVGAHGARPS